VALVMCALAALAVAQSLGGSVRARAKELAVLRAVGASAGDVRALVLAEAALLGVVGGLLGLGLARVAAAGADRALARALPDSPLRPETLFAFPPWLLAVGLGIAVLAALVGALAPAALAARLDPARSLA
jgi:ABC-type antimicrobial peptide transport system permease subunit